MAITYPHWCLLVGLKDMGVLPQGGVILEIGQANLYGDFDAWKIGEHLDDAGKEELASAISAADYFALARLVYRAMFATKEVIAIDFNGTADAIKLDLNRPITLKQEFDVCFNHGTAEHIFDIGNVFRTMHNNAKVGALMIHESPFTGWIDHGFYCLQPTLFWDVAAANGYEIVLFAIEDIANAALRTARSREELLDFARRGELAGDLMLFVAMRKTSDARFVVPMQGVYGGGVSADAVSAWMELKP